MVSGLKSREHKSFLTEFDNTHTYTLPENKVLFVQIALLKMIPAQSNKQDMTMNLKS